MADTDTRAAPTEQPRDESRSEAWRDLNKTVAQRQKLLLAGIGGVALIAGSMFIFGGEDEAGADGAGATTIETGALVNRNLSQREFVATVRRQNIWHNLRRRLTECGPRLGLMFRRRACGVASADVRVSFA